MHARIGDRSVAAADNHGRPRQAAELGDPVPQPLSGFDGIATHFHIAGVVTHLHGEVDAVVGVPRRETTQGFAKCRGREVGAARAKAESRGRGSYKNKAGSWRPGGEPFFRRRLRPPGTVSKAADVTLRSADQ